MTREEFLHEVIRMKGEIIHYVSLNEYQMNFILADYLNSDEDKILFGMAIMNKLNFNNRIDIFKHFLNKKNNDFRTKYPDLLKNINEMQTIRNKFAHSMNQVPHKENFNIDDEFFILKTDKFDATDFARTTYNSTQHKFNLAILKKTLVELVEISGLKGANFD